MEEEQPTQNLAAEPEAEKVDLTQKETTLLEWEASEYNTYERGWKWILAIIVCSLLVIGYSIYTRDWFIIAIVILVNVFIFIYTKKQPRTLKYRVTQLGLYAGDHFYPFSEIHSFWLSLKVNERKLNIIFIKKYLPQLSILLKDTDPIQVKTIFGKYIPEQENRTESIMDFLSRLLKIQ